MKPFYPKTRVAWRAWLKANHRKETECVMLCYTKDSGKPTVHWQHAVQEALCFGWIDSIVRRIDDQRYTRRFTPRKPNSLWSRINKEHTERLIAEGKMAAAGLEQIREAKQNGRWYSAYSVSADQELPADLKRALQKNKPAWVFFQGFSNTAKHVYLVRITGAKTAKMRALWIARTVEYSAKRLKPYVKGKPVWNLRMARPSNRP